MQVSVQDYVAGRMSAAEREEFEGRLVIRRELSAGARRSRFWLREGMEVLREQKALERRSLSTNGALRLCAPLWGFAGAVAAVL